MTRRFLLLLVLVAGCGGTYSPAQVRAARETEYRADAAPQIFAGIRKVMKEQDYRIDVDEPENGLVASTWIPYARTDGRRFFFRIGVQLQRGPRGGIVLAVDGVVRDYRVTFLGSPLQHGDPDEPTWVRTRIDNLAVALHHELAPLAL